MAKRTRIQNRIARQLPREGAFNDRIAGLHRAGDLDLAQRLTVGDLDGRERQCTGQNRGELVLRADVDGQRDVLIVCALDYYGRSTHRAGGFHVIFLNGQGQLAVFRLRAAGVVAVI